MKSTGITLHCSDSPKGRVDDADIKGHYEASTKTCHNDSVSLYKKTT